MPLPTASTYTQLDSETPITAATSAALTATSHPRSRQIIRANRRDGTTNTAYISPSSQRRSHCQTYNYDVKTASNVVRQATSPRTVPAASGCCQLLHTRGCAAVLGTVHHMTGEATRLATSAAVRVCLLSPARVLRAGRRKPPRQQHLFTWPFAAADAAVAWRRSL